MVAWTQGFGYFNPIMPTPPTEIENMHATRLLAEYLRKAGAMRDPAMPGFVRVIGNEGGAFLISDMGNVMGRTGGGGWVRYCVNSLDRSMPYPDHVLAKVLVIQSDEALFRETAVVQSPVPDQWMQDCPRMFA